MGTSHQIFQSSNQMLAFLLFLVAAAVHGDEIVCGEPEISPKPPGQKILNGEEATPHSFPWQVSITGALNYDADHYCGASILSPSWVLTAAHCAEIVYIGTYTGDVVWLGMHDRRGGEDDANRQMAKFSEDSKWYQAGIVSFGPSPCDTQIPSVFTRVAGFRDWIEKTVEQSGGWE